MLIDVLEHAGCWEISDQAILEALRFLQQGAAARLAPGTYALRGRELYAIVSEYEPRPREECRLETHRRCIDVQYVVSGQELLGYAPAAFLEPAGPYDPERDVQFHRGPADFVLLRQGMFAVLLPADGHMPGVASGERAGAVKKIVLKVAVSSSRPGASQPCQPSAPGS